MLYGKIILTTLILLVYSNCKPVEDINSTENKPDNVKTINSANQENIEGIPNDLLINLERTMCYGDCPAYKLSVKSDGSILFEGLAYTKVKGKAEGKINEEKIKQLIKEFSKADYFNLNDKYDYDTCSIKVTDQSTVKTSIQMNSRKKSVSHYLGCVENNTNFEEMLSKLTDLEDKIDEIIETKRWIGERK